MISEHRVISKSCGLLDVTPFKNKRNFWRKQTTFLSLVLVTFEPNFMYNKLKSICKGDVVINILCTKIKSEKGKFMILMATVILPQLHIIDNLAVKTIVTFLRYLEHLIFLCLHAVSEKFFSIPFLKCISSE